MIQQFVTCAFLATSALGVPSDVLAEASATQLANASASAIAATTTEYSIVEMSLQDFFNTLQWDTGQRVVVGPDVAGTLRNEVLAGTALEIINEITTRHALNWFAYDGVIHVSRSQDDVTKFIPLEGISAAHAVMTLDQSGLSSEFGVFKPIADGAAVSISGPPEFVSIAEAILTLTPTSPEHSAIRVRRGTDTSVEHYGADGMLDDNQPAPEPVHTFVQVQTTPAPSTETSD